MGETVSGTLFETKSDISSRELWYDYAVAWELFLPLHLMGFATQLQGNIHN